MGVGKSRGVIMSGERLLSDEACTETPFVTFEPGIYFPECEEHQERDTMGKLSSCIQSVQHNNHFHDRVLMYFIIITITHSRMRLPHGLP